MTLFKKHFGLHFLYLENQEQQNNIDSVLNFSIESNMTVIKCGYNKVNG